MHKGRALNCQEIDRTSVVYLECISHALRSRTVLMFRIWWPEGRPGASEWYLHVWNLRAVISWFDSIWSAFLLFCLSFSLDLCVWDRLSFPDSFFPAFGRLLPTLQKFLLNFFFLDIGLFVWPLFCIFFDFWMIWIVLGFVLFLTCFVNWYRPCMTRPACAYCTQGH